jgi:cytochrome c5
VSKPNRRFFNVFSSVLSILVAAAIGVSLSSCKPGGGGANPGSAEDVAGRTQPFGEVAVAGQDDTGVAATSAAEAPATDAPAAPAATDQAPAAVTAAATAVVSAAAPAANGASTYKSACSVCHGAGIAGAPKFGDKAAWATRITQDAAVLHRHAVEGYKGPAGVMPAKGGRMDLSDDAVIAAVDYMVAGSR